MSHPDICIAGAGIVGLSLALELHGRGMRVAVLDRGEPLAEASTAAAGMLAAHDPENPPELLPLSELSLSLYPDFLERLFDLSGLQVPFHTSTTLQALPPGHHELARHVPVLAPEALSLLLPGLTPGDHRFLLLSEQSLDPRELAPALLAAVRSTPIELRTHTPIRILRSNDDSVEIHTAADVLHASRFIDCTGAWGFTSTLPSHLRVSPRKGQMLAVALPPSLPLHLVLRTPEIYIVPRTNNATAVRAIIGATVESAGFDKTIYPADIARLRALASQLLPPIADAPELETWAGLRPSTLDNLPLLGPVPGSTNHYVATGHFRNGILLAPATARVMAQLIAGERPSVNLAPFSPLRPPRPQQ
ncbi:NAD(P)/FAD-dependent oxidoreductase [Edaphobacter aggregans]|uniref:NAD(P)/FAD-dependent oxidoreductase n=1 Tax=Edaphobacter aggregans TaxID=570835 RepID=UPI0005584395|nr:FAD-dependent oxidoreductase [Edaphobacter aggregans]